MWDRDHLSISAPRSPLILVALPYGFLGTETIYLSLPQGLLYILVVLAGM